MTQLRRLCFDSLRAHLRGLLGQDALLAHQLDRALATKDAVRLEHAMDALALYPEPLREAVEQTILDWLTATRRAPAGSAAESA